MANLTRQDVQQVVDIARNYILQRTITRQDLQTVCDSMRDRMMAYIQEVNQQNQQILRQATYQNAQLVRRTIALETRVLSQEQELRILRQHIAKLLETQPQQIVLPALPADPKQSQPQEYVYRPE